MSGTGKPETGPTHTAGAYTAGAQAAGDPSMEDILASIRRILSEDEAAPAAPAAAASDDVLLLDESMIRTETPMPHPEVPAVPALPAAAADPADSLEDAPAGADPLAALMAPETAAAAASSVGSLLRAIASDRALQVRSGGPSIEDLVRQALRPLLKEWLDAHLPGLVERLVRSEIERVVGRAMN